MPMVKSVGGIAADSPIRAWTGTPRTLPTRSWSAISIAHFAAPWPRIAPSIAAVGRLQPAGGRLELPDGLEQHRHDDGHRLGRLAVEPVGIALADPDDPREAVVAKLDDDAS